MAGNGGNDVLDGGAGADTLNGGLGDDSFYVDNAGDAVVEVAGQGVDTVFSAITFSLAGSFADNIILTGAADLNGTGNGLDNLLTGNSGANTLTGGDGNDVLDGGGGIDSLVGGLGDDVFLVDNAADAVVEAAGGGTDTIVAA
ncbi:MAG: calcium-binding protein, partial [Asticcacaulis sp.]|nr:calcium-binding protein [Asticcacaulis sp.]